MLALPARAAELAPESGWTVQQSALCSAAIAVAERRRGTLPGLLGAVARAESGRPVPPLPGLQPWPWAVNADGAAYYFESKTAAVVWVRLALARGAQQVDVGCMQINLQSHPGAFASLEEAFEPSSNADYGARYLAALQDEAGGNWYVATGWYHSHTPVLAADYRERVAAIAAGRIPPASLGMPAVHARDPAGDAADRARRGRGDADQPGPAASRAAHGRGGGMTACQVVGGAGRRSWRRRPGPGAGGRRGRGSGGRG